MRTLSGGTLCSGALLNTTAGDGTPFVLTADHCGQTSNTLFSFRYEREGCGSGASTRRMTVTGAEVLTTNPTMDSRLLRLTSSVPLEFEPYLAGWTRSTVSASSVIAMGHPGGGPKTITL